jgi:hypothetical protein
MAEETKKDANQILAEILLRQEEEKMQAKEAERLKKLKSAQQNALQEKQAATNRAAKQTICDHLMGNHVRGREKPPSEIPDLSLDTYASGKSRIRCNRCGYIWTPKTTRQKSFDWRTGKPTGPNPTQMSWQDAYKMQMQNQLLGNKAGRAFRVIKIEQEEFV